MLKTKVLLVTVVIGVLSTPAMASPKDMALCGKLAGAWKAAFNAGDAAKVAAMYDPSAGQYSTPYWTAAGRDGLEKGLKGDMSMGVSYNDITCDGAEHDGKLLVAHGTFAGSAKGPDGKSMPLTGHWFAAARDDGGKYLMTTHIANIQLPPPK